MQKLEITKWSRWHSKPSPGVEVESVEASQVLKGLSPLDGDPGLGGMAHIAAYVSVQGLVQLFEGALHFHGPLREGVDGFPGGGGAGGAVDLKASARSWMRGQRAQERVPRFFILGQRPAVFRVGERYQASRERTRGTREQTPGHRLRAVLKSRNLNVDPMRRAQQFKPQAAMIKRRVRDLRRKLEPLFAIYGKGRKAQLSAIRSSKRMKSRCRAHFQGCSSDSSTRAVLSELNALPAMVRKTAAS